MLAVPELKNEIPDFRSPQLLLALNSHRAALRAGSLVSGLASIPRTSLTSHVVASYPWELTI